MNQPRPNHSVPAAMAGQRHPHRNNCMLAHPSKIVAGLFAAGLLALGGVACGKRRDQARMA